MALKTIFPEEMMKSSENTAMTLEGIASKLFYFEQQLQLIHWKTLSFAEHKATNDLYDYVSDFRDGVVEKLMGYMNKRPSGLKVPPVTNISATAAVDELCDFAYSLCEWAEQNHYSDIENMAQELSGKSNQVKYLLTLS